MNTVHLDLQGKTARVLFQSLPCARQKPAVRNLTSKGAVASARIVNGVNPQVDPFKITAQELIAGDPELAPHSAGEMLDVESLSAAFYDPENAAPAPVADFKQIDIVYDPAGAEKERRPHVTRMTNLNDLHPIKIGKRLPIAQALTDFVYKQVYQIVHEDGVTKDFLFDLAQDLHTKQEIAVLGAGPKGNQPLVVRDKGTPYRAFLYGEIGVGEDKDKYKLLLLLSDQELKRPTAPAPAP
ncbi:MAG TPA: hypothetical protein VGH90_07920 [Chthoniobacteraceae bacterium]|jgi:hypothetical protein